MLRRVAEHLQPRSTARAPSSDGSASSSTGSASAASSSSSTGSASAASSSSSSSSEAIDAAVWTEVAAAVAANDCDAMAATYHPDAVLVSTTGTTAMQQQLVTWRAGMDTIRSENRRASVAFRFASRQDGETTAFESGMFRYAETDADGVEQPAFVPMEALLVKVVRARHCRWFPAAGRQSAVFLHWRPGAQSCSVHFPFRFQNLNGCVHCVAGWTMGDAHGAPAGATGRGGVGRAGAVTDERTQSAIAQFKTRADQP